MKLLLFMLALVAAGDAIGIENTAPAPQWSADARVPTGALPWNDLAIDSTFGGVGYVIGDFNDSDGKKDVALRVFPGSDGGYWIAGYHAVYAIQEGGYLAVAKLNADGSLDSSYNGSGKKTFASTIVSLADVALGTGDRLYFVGSYIASGASDTDLEIDCIDAVGNPCAGFANTGPDGVIRLALDLGDAAHLDDVPTRILYNAGALYVAGTSDTGSGASNFALFALKLTAANGAPDAVFGNMPGHAGLFVHNIDHAVNGYDIANDVLAYSTAAGGRLILVGQTQRAAAPDVDGFVMSVDAPSGTADAFIDDSVYADLGDTREDTLLRVIRRRNGGFVVAGHAIDNHSTYTSTHLLMAAYNADGSRDLGFGPPGDNGQLLLLLDSYHNTPFGLAERADSRDLVVGVNAAADISGDGHGFEGIVQLGSTGNPLHAGAELDLPGTPMDTQGKDLALIGNRALTAGVRVWSAFPIVDQDMAVARYVATDTIFADRFGGNASD